MRGEIVAFPDVYAGLDTGVLLRAYGLGPSRIHDALVGLTEDALRARPITGKWSILEIAMHVADSELVGATRIRLVLGGDRPVLPGYDQDRWSDRMAYNSSSRTQLDDALMLFSALRAATMRLFGACTAPDWTRTGVHADYGAVSLRQLLELYADHSERHLGQIVARRELLGAPLPVPLLLPQRLY